ncbi:MAG TPA: histidine kinase [Acidimicrobiia bacterium]|nr:histidine kinase [Acidimicrobiia bacterium]
MGPLVVAFLILMAVSLAAGLLATALQREPLRPWVEVGLAGILLTNIGTAMPDQLGRTTGPPSWLLTTAMVAWLLMLFTFPDGQPAPPWTRWILGSSIVLVVLALVPSVPETIRVVAFISAFGIGVASQVWRFQRRSTVPERQATKWLLVGLVPAVSLFVGLGVIVSTTALDPVLFEESWYGAASLIAIWLVPISGAIGLRMGDRGRIDEVLHVLIVFCGVGLLVGWAYFLVRPTIGPTWAAFTAILLVLPARWLVRRSATRVVYGRDASSAVSILGQRLETSVNAEDVARVVAQTVAEGLALPYAAVCLDGAVAAEAGVAPGESSDPALERFPVTYLGSAIGAILVVPRSGDVALAARDRAAVDRLAVAAAPALHSARTLQELSMARERLVLTREEERRRLRRDLHDDLAPTLAGLGLRAAAAASLDHVENERIQRLYADLQEGIQGAIAQVREIAHNLRPPVLDDHGLEAAIRARLATDSDPDLQVEIEVDSLPSPMSAAVELAALRIVQEAVTNVRRHADATNCWIALLGRNGQLHVHVTDDGRGIPSEHARGVGLRSIMDRAQELGGTSEIGVREFGGTKVSVTLPTRGVHGW